MNKKLVGKITILVVVMLLVGVTTALAASVNPVPYENFEHKDAGHICVRELGFDFGIKIEAWGGPGGSGDFDKGPGTYDDHDYFFDPEFDNTITITPPNPRYTFDWKAADYAIGAVVVQGGPMDNIFFYNPALWEDTDLYPYDSETNKQDKISHISFCWMKTGDNGDDECYQEETAWAAGDPYIEADQWAMYVTYEEGLTVDVIAGQNYTIGTATFSAPDENDNVTITINLTDGWIFYYDVADDEEDDNLKVQDYETAPEGNPPIGLFDWKIFIPVGSTDGEIIVPLNDFYGVHLDVAQLIECPVE